MVIVQGKQVLYSYRPGPATRHFEDTTYVNDGLQELCEQFCLVLNTK